MELPSILDNEKKFLFHNWSKEDFVGFWGGEPTTIKAGETREFAMFLAYHFTKHFVDREMEKDGKSALLGVDDLRKTYENKTISEVSAGVDSPALATLKEKIQSEVEQSSKVEKKTGKKLTTKKVGEIEDLK